MKSVSTKISAIIAMVISVLSLGLIIAAFIVSVNEEPVDMGVSRSFALWVYAVIVSMISLFFYFIDAVLSIVKAVMKIHPIFNIVLAVMLIGAIPMAIYVGGGLGINVYIWFSYYLAIFVLEVISIVKHIKMIRIKENSLTENTEG